jgi:hypothetical protein
MRSHRLTKLICGVLAVLMIGGVSIVAVGHAADEKAKEKKERAEMRGPLPTFYRDVIDGIQKDKMYKIHESYEPQIDELKKQVKALEDKRDAELEALLRPDQKERVKELMAQAAKERKAKKAEATK